MDQESAVCLARQQVVGDLDVGPGLALAMVESSEREGRKYIIDNKPKEYVISMGFNKLLGLG